MSTKAVEVSIQAVSPLFGAGASAQASAGASASSAAPRSCRIRLAFALFGMATPGHFGPTAPQIRPARAHVGLLSFGPKKRGAASVPLTHGACFPCFARPERAALHSFGA